MSVKTRSLASRKGEETRRSKARKRTKATGLFTICVPSHKSLFHLLFHFFSERHHHGFDEKQGHASKLWNADPSAFSGLMP
jgi:hypothetical protein